MNASGNSRISPEPVLLGYLYKEALHGYELHKRMTDEFGYIWHASQSQTYNIINRLIDQGYITFTSVEQEKHPSKQVLQISQAGIGRFEAWLKSPTKCSVHAIRVEFITRLYFMRLYDPEHAGDMIKDQAEVVKDGIEKLYLIRENFSGQRTLNRMALDLRIKLLQSVVEWLKGLSTTTMDRNSIGVKDD
jgi:DNA-binding PadR family transcriptional regulator